MAVVNIGPSNIQRVRNTYTFVAGTTGTVATHDVFTITGRVILRTICAFTTTSLVSAGGGNVEIGLASDTDYWCTKVATDYSTTNNNIGNLGPSAIPQVVNFADGVNAALALDENVVLKITVGAVSAGVIVFDAWYEPVTDDGALT